jgi:hypothetical protein
VGRGGRGSRSAARQSKSCPSETLHKADDQQRRVHDEDENAAVVAKRARVSEEHPQEETSSHSSKERSQESEEEEPAQEGQEVSCTESHFSSSSAGMAPCPHCCGLLGLPLLPLPHPLSIPSVSEFAERVTEISGKSTSQAQAPLLARLHADALSSIYLDLLNQCLRLKHDIAMAEWLDTISNEWTKVRRLFPEGSDVVEEIKKLQGRR